MAVYDKDGNLIGEVNSEGTGSGSSKVHRPYWVLHLDCGRKLFSVVNIKKMIDKMATCGMNQLQLHFVENLGFRFALNDMTIVTTDGDEYDLTSCVSTTNGGALSEADMDEIIVYARSKKIDIVPSLNMPGHMNPIIAAFPQFRYYTDRDWTLNVKDDTAVKFALAIVEKYAKYFASRGCTFWNIGADEIGSMDDSRGRWQYVNSEDIPTFVNFVNKVAELVTSMGFTPRAFNDGAIYGGNYANLYNKNIEIYSWCERFSGEQPVNTLVKNGYTLINTNRDWYFIVPSSNSETRNELVENANILKEFKSGTTTYDQDGACICIWCDTGGTYDGGNAAINSILADIESFGIGIQLTLAQLDYPIID